MSYVQPKIYLNKSQKFPMCLARILGVALTAGNTSLIKCMDSLLLNKHANGQEEEIVDA